MATAKPPIKNAYASLVIKIERAKNAEDLLKVINSITETSLDLWDLLKDKIRERFNEIYANGNLEVTS